MIQNNFEGLKSETQVGYTRKNVQYIVWELF